MSGMGRVDCHLGLFSLPTGRVSFCFSSLIHYLKYGTILREDEIEGKYLFLVPLPNAANVV